MIERTLKISGTVQKVGYRDVVDDIAFHHGVVGTVKNLEDHAVQVICQGTREKIDAFEKALYVEEEFVEVTGVETIVEHDIENPTYKHFKIEYDDLAIEFGERMVQGIHYMRETMRIGKETNEGVKDLGNKMDSMNENLGEKLDAVNDNLGKKIDDGFDNLGTKLDSVNENLGEKLDSVNENLGDKIDHGFESTGEHSQSLDGKYHTVTEELRKIREVLEKGLEVEEG